MIVALSAENKIKNILYCTVRDSPVTLANIKIKAEKDFY